MYRRSDRGLLADWWWTVDRWFLLAFGLLMGFGMMLSFAASPNVAERIGLDTFHFVERHAFFLLPAIAVMLVLSFLDDRQTRRVALAILCASLVLLMVTLFFGVEVKGSKRWVRIAGISVQPSEFLKPSFVILCAWLFAEHAKRPDIPGNLFAGILFAIAGSLLVAQPDLGQTVLLAGTWGAMFFLAGMNWLWIGVLGGVGAIGLVGAYLTMPHVAGRIDRFISGQGDTFQVDTGREAIVRGGWFGQGPGEGTVKRILPDSHTDFVFAVLGEEYGIVACMILVAVFGFIVLRGLMKGAGEKDQFRRLAVCGLAVMIGLQSMINIMVNLNLLPAKGMTLPFVSYGGSSMIAVAISAGFLLSLTRRRAEQRSRHTRFDMPGKRVPLPAE
ncbi:MAG: putative lipid II flippase FtsW [Pseudomonadota bacterium]